MMCSTSMPRVAMRSKMNVGMCWPAIRSGSGHTSSANGTISASRRFADGCVVASITL